MTYQHHEDENRVPRPCLHDVYERGSSYESLQFTETSASAVWGGRYTYLKAVGYVVTRAALFPDQIYQNGNKHQATTIKALPLQPLYSRLEREGSTGIYPLKHIEACDYNGLVRQAAKARSFRPRVRMRISYLLISAFCLMSRNKSLLALLYGTSGLIPM